MFDEFEVPRTLLPALPGEPVVLGLAEHWDELSPEALRLLQGELEQLGASLLLISSRELLCLRPAALGDAVVRSSRLRQLWPSGLGPWHRAPAVNAARGPGCTNTRRSLLTLALIDEQGVVRWLQRSAQSAAALELLQGALARARQRLLQPRLASAGRTPAARPFSRAELIAGLGSALSAAFGQGQAGPAVSRSQAASGDSWPPREAARSLR